MRYGSHQRYPYWAKRAAAHSVSCHGGIFLCPIWRKPEDKVTDMGYPGDQGQYGGWGSEQPPPSQYAPGQGTTVAFTCVALAFLGLFLLGWRTAATAWSRRGRAAADRPPAPRRG